METLSEKEEKYIKSWSWGAFFGSWIFLFVNKQYKLGWKILALYIFMGLFSYVPMFVIQANGFGKILNLIYLGVIIWLSIRGREIVWKSKIYTSVENFKKKQSLVAKLNVVLFVVTFTLMIFSFVSTYGKFVGHPELIDQAVMQEALVKAKSSDSNINDSEFEQGYQKGITDGNADIARTFIADQASSYQAGYPYGYAVACMKIHNDQTLCMKKALGNK